MDNASEYIKNQPIERVFALEKLRTIIINNLPDGFEERIQYNMITYVVPYSIYKNGYHVDKKELPFISFANQKGYIALYHMGIYMDKELLYWFENEYKNLNIGKLDMGKSCIRFKKIEKIPYELIGELCTKMKVSEYVDLYESNRQKR